MSGLSLVLSHDGCVEIPGLMFWSFADAEVGHQVGWSH